MLSDTISRVAGYIATLTIFFPLLTGCVRIKTLVREQRVLFFLVLLGAVSELILYILGRNKTNNLFVIHFFTAAEFILLSGVYFAMFRQKTIRTVLVLLLCIFLVMMVADVFYIESLKKLNPLSSAIESLLIIIYSLFCFLDMLKKLVYRNIFENPMFYFNSGVLIYFSGNLFLFIFSNYVLKSSSDYFNEMWVIHDVFNILMNILFGFALWKR